MCEYSCYNAGINTIRLTAKVSRYKYTPEGSNQDWGDKGREVANKHNKNVDVYYEQQDKETGYTRKYFIKTVQPDEETQSCR